MVYGSVDVFGCCGFIWSITHHDTAEKERRRLETKRFLLRLPCEATSRVASTQLSKKKKGGSSCLSLGGVMSDMIKPLDPKSGGFGGGGGGFGGAMSGAGGGVHPHLSPALHPHHAAMSHYMYQHSNVHHHHQGFMNPGPPGPPGPPPHPSMHHHHMTSLGGLGLAATSNGMVLTCVLINNIYNTLLTDIHPIYGRRAVRRAGGPSTRDSSPPYWIQRTSSTLRMRLASPPQPNTAGSSRTKPVSSGSNWLQPDLTSFIRIELAPAGLDTFRSD
uniref:Uncharacterized protein n=1 Tax=Timema poppense TaxID=170557 RepID=A0A7R9DF19_TIMPO|nr:unnamed protein product [Timema poppensis]